MLRLTPPVFTILRHLIEEATGIRYELDDIDLVLEKIRPRLEEHELDSVLDYYYFLRYDAGGAAEIEKLTELLVVNETYFYRERAQLDTLVSEILPPCVARSPRRRARVWSAACSTGEEPLTLAMMLADAGMLEAVDILATDLSRRVLAKAAEGVYGGRSFRSLPPSAEKYFAPREGTTKSVRADLRAAIRWERLNLLDEPAVLAAGHFDAILCRNVLIYFADPTVQSVAHSLTRALAPGGVLLIGASESLLRFGTELECSELGGAFFYRKPLG